MGWIICTKCKIYQIDTYESYKRAKDMVGARQHIQLKGIRNVLTKALEKYNIHDKLFINHLVTIQAKLLHMNIKNLKL